MSFEILAKAPEGGRVGRLKTAHGVLETPAFLPVATQAAVKALSAEDLETLGVRGVLSNSYHLYLRPGLDVVREAGGLHRFMNFKGMILTDSGGFQVMSLASLSRVEPSGVEFKSHIDGSLHRLTPASVIETQAVLGSDCWTPLDVCLSYPADARKAREALELTLAWCRESAEAFLRRREAGAESLFFPILQGGFEPELRERAAEELSKIPHDGVALGGFSVGEPKELTWRILECSLKRLPEERPRYLMGVGTPEDLWEAAGRGVDMMDCVWPTRVARNGQAATSRGKVNISNSAHRLDSRPLDPDCGCFVCRGYSRAYLSHHFKSRELSAYRLLTYHNLHFMAAQARAIRDSLRDGSFSERKDEFLGRYLSESPA